MNLDRRIMVRPVRALLAMTVIAGAFALSGCAYGMRAVPKTPLVPPPGIIFTKYKAPLDFDFADVEEGQSGTSAESRGTNVMAMKAGVADAYFLSIPFTYGLVNFAWGDCSLETATSEGNISTLHYADYETLSVLMLFTKFTVEAYGE